jgi:hypothetical protein
MKYQFGTPTLLLAAAFIGICLAGFVAEHKITSPNGISWEWFEWRWTIGEICVAGPVYVPAIFLAFALGRRAMTVRILLAFALTEAAVLVSLKLLVDYS